MPFPFSSSDRREGREGEHSIRMMDDEAGSGTREEEEEKEQTRNGLLLLLLPLKKRDPVKKGGRGNGQVFLRFHRFSTAAKKMPCWGYERWIEWSWEKGRKGAGAGNRGTECFEFRSVTLWISIDA